MSVIQLDVHRIAIRLHQGASFREIGREIGASRSTVQRRFSEAADVMVDQEVIAGHAKAHGTIFGMTTERAEAGLDPLPAGHPISWNAIALQSEPV